MADVFVTLSDLVKINDQNLADLDVSNLLDDAPVLKRLYAQEPSNGTEHKYLQHTGNPSVGFRAAYDGRENKASAETLVTVTLKIFDASFGVDKAIADAYKKGVAAFLAREGAFHLRQAFAELEQQIFYGTGNDSAGFAGLSNNTAYDALADAMVVNAAGTTASTGSSCWLIRTNENALSVIAPEDGKLEMGETVVTRLAGSSTGWYPGYWTPITGWFGLQLGGTYDIVRIANLTADSGKGLTDSLISSAISKFKAAAQPNLIVCTRRSLMQLQKSRTATNPTGAPAPFPDSSFGIPIVVTDQLSDTETLLS